MVGSKILTFGPRSGSGGAAFAAAPVSALEIAATSSARARIVVDRTRNMEPPSFLVGALTRATVAGCIPCIPDPGAKHVTCIGDLWPARRPSAAPRKHELLPRPAASVRVLVLPPCTGLRGLAFRRSLEQGGVVRRDERVRRRHGVGVIDGLVLARKGDPA